MQRYIKLADLDHIPTPDNGTFTPTQLAQGRAAMVAQKLRFDNATGKLFDNELGCCEQFSNPRDHVPAQSAEEVMRWQFSRYINNSASRIARGYKP